MVDSSLTKQQVVESLYQYLESVLNEHQKRSQNMQLYQSVMKLAAWQSERLVSTYEDMMHMPRYTEAMHFFRCDMYAPKDFSRRDLEAQKVLPMMTKIVPAHMVETLESVMELNALTMRLDTDLALALLNLGVIDAINGDNYAAAYRLCDNYKIRAYQIKLLIKLGQAVERYVHMPYISMTLKMMKKPASLLGLSELHEFFERGYSGFKQIGDSGEFLSEIKQREQQILENIFNSHPEPFTIKKNKLNSFWNSLFAQQPPQTVEHS